MARIELRGAMRAALLAAACAVLASGCRTDGGGPAAPGRAGPAVRLAPDPAFANARLAVVFGEAVPDPSACRFEWRRNGARIDGASSAELEPSRFARGDRVSVRVVAPGIAEPLVAEVRIANSAPRVLRAGIAMEPAPGGDVLRVHAECVDADGDTPRLEVAWFRNGAPVEGASGTSLPAAFFERGDRVTVSVIARDDESESPPVAADPFEVENRPPSFTSSPAAPRPGDTVFEYRAVAVDPDGDPLRYELALAPGGMTVDARGGVRWELPAAARGPAEHPVRIRATDARGGEAVQEFTIRR